MASFTRHIITKSESKPDVLDIPIALNRDLITFKALLVRKTSLLEEKVGAFGSSSRIGQGIQAIGSVAIPGDYSDIRSPIRSRIYSALTPGGGNGRNIPGRKPTRGYRCSEGFQFGGRFTDSRYSTCGQRLFDIASLGRTIGAALGAVARRGSARPAGQNIDTDPITGAAPTNDVVLSRQPDIPRVGPANVRQLVISTDLAASSLVDAPIGSSYLVRRDGYALKPVVTAGVLRTVPDNRNMEGATYLLSAPKRQNIGGEELGLLSNTGVTSLQYVLPNGERLSLERSRPLTVGERRKIGRTVNEIMELDNSQDRSARLKAFAEASGGGIKYSEVKPGQRKPSSVDSQSDDDREIAAKPAKSGKINTIDQAINHLDNNGEPGDIAPKILSQALNKASSYKAKKLAGGTTLYERSDGKGFYEIPSKGQFEHIGARVASDIQKTLGLTAPSVRFMGEGSRRPYLLDHPRNMVEGGSLGSGKAFTAANAGDSLKLAVADWLTDERMRTPGNIIPFKNPAGDGAMATSNRTAGLTNLSKTQISQRQKLGIDDMFNNVRRGAYNSAFADLSAQQRKLLITQLDKLIKDADAFNWDEYYARLMVDGELSSAERSHLKIIQSIYSNRLNTIRSSKQQFLKAIGVE